jgi:prepilin-type N-terminal cleavage/methylation domain-containing protein
MWRNRRSGFSLLEMMVVVTMTLILSVVAIPAYTSTVRYLRMSGDCRNLNSLVALAKMGAAADFTHARAYADLNANTYHIELWNKTGNGGAGCWQTIGDRANPCTVAASPVQFLSPGDSFGVGILTAPPANTQAALAQAPACDNGAGGTIANTACVVFNSRGIPIVAGTPNGNGALYITNTDQVYGVTIAASGSIQTWSAPNHSSTTWQHR